MTVETIEARDCPKCGGVFNVFPHRMRDREAEERSDKGSQPEPSAVDHPPHYSEGRRIEPIEVITDWGLGFCLGNAVKYIGRAGRKGDALEDLRKALWYLEREIKEREGRQ